MECGRKLGTYLRKRQAMQRQSARRDVFERYIGEISKAVNAINPKHDTKRLYDALLIEARKRTAIADAELDEEGKIVKKDEDDFKEDDAVILVENRVVGAAQPAAAESTNDKDTGDIVKLSSKPKAKKSKQKELFD